MISYLRAMKRVLLLFICLFVTLGAQAQEKKPSMQRKVFVKQFLKHVCDNNDRKVRKCLNKNYRKEQTKFLGGNRKQLLDELFSGLDDAAETHVIPFDDIASIEIYEVAEITVEDKIAWVYVFKVSDGVHTILAPLLLEKYFGSFGFIGARG